MNLQIRQLVLMFILGGFFIFILFSLVSLFNSIRKAAHQVEITAATFDNILNDEFRFLLIRGEKTLGELEDILPLVKDKLTHVPAKDVEHAFLGIAGHLERSLIVWIVKEALRKTFKRS